MTNPTVAPTDTFRDRLILMQKMPVLTFKTENILPRNEPTDNEMNFL
jgi:hypothetical protein